MLQDFTAENWLDDDQQPLGGFASGVGMSITWQNGPLGRGDDRIPPNGAFVETVIAAAKQRIEFYQSTEFACAENAWAINRLQGALDWLNDRTQRRECEGVEGTHAL